VNDQPATRHRRRWPFALAALVALLVPVLVSATGTSASVARAKKPQPWPKPIRPIIRPALRGEGVWHRTGPNYHGGPPVLVTVFRTDPAYPSVVAYLAWYDHTRTSVAFYPGRYEPPNAAVRGPMMVPYGQRHRLLSTFNAGFTYAYNGNGSSINGRENEPLKKGLATLVQYKSGAINIVIWNGGVVTSKRLAWARQSLPPIVWNGKLNPKLDDSKAWGETIGNSVRVWRTGVGIDRRGNLMFAVADSQTVKSLARILKHAGAVRAMQFDINSYWHTLITYTHTKHGLVPTLVEPQPNHTAERYLTPDDRDFFAVYRRLPGNFTVPFK
jgi:hypothetical protein